MIWDVLPGARSQAGGPHFPFRWRPIRGTGGLELPSRHISHYLAVFFGALFLSALALTGVVNWLGKSVGATNSLSDLASLQAKDRNAIVLPFDLRYWAGLKLPRLAAEKPDVIFISSSRGGAMRSEMLAPYKFYNLSFTAWTLDQVTEILDRATREFAPKVAIVSLDYFMFTNLWPKINAKNAMRFADPFYRFRSGVDMMRAAQRYDGFLANCIIPILKTQHRCRARQGRFLGTPAILYQEGFRADGSYRYGAGRIHDPKTLTADYLTNAMPGAPSIDPKQMLALERLVALANERGIRLVGIQLPFMKLAIDYLDTNARYRDLAGVWREFESRRLQEQFRRMGIAFFDLSRAPLTQDLNNFVDAYHPSEIGMLRSLRDLLADPQFKEIFPAIDPDLISRQTSEAESKKEYFHVYGD
ncbi:hydrolase [Bradyrhizobium diazoefficiens]|nr:hydrolase [Bradyrhizobium diazoefficiens]MBR0852289.1 hydrolase [Bradyrhizobium diazoefficiens]